MVELFEKDEQRQKRRSSKGNQLKWENEGVWYKADYTGYEGLTEYVVSRLLEKSSLKQEEFVHYELEEIKYKQSVFNGVKSRSFLHGDWQLVTLERLFKMTCNESITKTIWKIPDVAERLHVLVDRVQEVTGLDDFGKYMNKILTIDAIFLNEDRHMHNIAVLMNEKGAFAYCPIFDQGAGLLSDTTMDYPLGTETYELMKTVRAKTISTDFDEQLDVSEELYGCNLNLFFSKKDVKELLDQVEFYEKEVRQRVEQILYSQMGKYAYLFN